MASNVGVNNGSQIFSFGDSLGETSSISSHFEHTYVPSLSSTKCYPDHVVLPTNVLNNSRKNSLNTPSSSTTDFCPSLNGLFNGNVEEDTAANQQYLGGCYIPPMEEHFLGSQSFSTLPSAIHHQHSTATTGSDEYGTRRGRVVSSNSGGTVGKKGIFAGKVS